MLSAIKTHTDAIRSFFENIEATHGLKDLREKAEKLLRIRHDIQTTDSFVSGTKNTILPRNIRTPRTTLVDECDVSIATIMNEAPDAIRESSFLRELSLPLQRHLTAHFTSLSGKKSARIEANAKYLHLAADNLSYIIRASRQPKKQAKVA